MVNRWKSAQTPPYGYAIAFVQLGFFVLRLPKDFSLKKEKVKMTFRLKALSSSSVGCAFSEWLLVTSLCLCWPVGIYSMDFPAPLEAHPSHASQQRQNCSYSCKAQA
jgi:hypothetical protein